MIKGGKILCILLIATLCVPFQVSASDLQAQSENISYEIEQEIEKYDEKIASNLESLIKKGEQGKLQCFQRKFKTSTEAEDTNAFATYGLYEQVYSDGEREIIAQTELFEITRENILRQESHGMDGWDSNGAIRGYVTYYFDRSDVDGFPAVQVKKVSGGYEVHDSAFYVKSQEILYGQVGPGSDGFATNERVTKKPTSSSWSYNTGFTSHVITGEGTVYGVNYTLTVSRQNSTAATTTFTILNWTS